MRIDDFIKDNRNIIVGVTIICALIFVVYLYITKYCDKEKYEEEVRTITGETAEGDIDLTLEDNSDVIEFPKRIFQTWKSTTEIPDNMNYWQNTWQMYNPSYEYNLWDDAMNRDLIERVFPWFLETYDSYGQNINRADAIRYFYLYVNGGIYADMDFECLKEIDGLLEENKQYDIIFGKMKTNNGNDFVKSNNIPNAIMISKPRQIFWLFVFRQLEMNKNRGAIESQTGPVMLKEALLSYVNVMRGNESGEWIQEYMDKVPDEIKPVKPYSNIIIMEPKYLYPLSWSDLTSIDDLQRNKVLAGEELNETTQIMKVIYPDAYAITYWTHTW